MGRWGLLLLLCLSGSAWSAGIEALAGTSTVFSTPGSALQRDLAGRVIGISNTANNWEIVPSGYRSLSSGGVSIYNDTIRGGAVTVAEAESVVVSDALMASALDAAIFATRATSVVGIGLLIADLLQTTNWSWNADGSLSSGPNPLSLNCPDGTPATAGGLTLAQIASFFNANANPNRYPIIGSTTNAPGFGPGLYIIWQVPQTGAVGYYGDQATVCGGATPVQPQQNYRRGDLAPLIQQLMQNNPNDPGLSSSNLRLIDPDPYLSPLIQPLGPDLMAPGVTVSASGGPVSVTMSDGSKIGLSTWPPTITSGTPPPPASAPASSPLPPSSAPTPVPPGPALPSGAFQVDGLGLPKANPFGAAATPFQLPGNQGCSPAVVPWVNSVQFTIDMCPWIERYRPWEDILVVSLAVISSVLAVLKPGG